MLKQADSYEEVYGSFAWEVPEFLNMGVEVCDKHADGDGARNSPDATRKSILLETD